MDKGFICIKHDGFILKSAFFGNSPFLERTLKGTKLKTERKTKKSRDGIKCQQKLWNPQTSWVQPHFVWIFQSSNTFN